MRLIRFGTEVGNLPVHYEDYSSEQGAHRLISLAEANKRVDRMLQEKKLFSSEPKYPTRMDAELAFAREMQLHKIMIDPKSVPPNYESDFEPLKYGARSTFGLLGVAPKLRPSGATKLAAQQAERARIVAAENERKAAAERERQVAAAQDREKVEAIKQFIASVRKPSPATTPTAPKEALARAAKPKTPGKPAPKLASAQPPAKPVLVAMRGDDAPPTRASLAPLFAIVAFGIGAAAIGGRPLSKE